LLRSEVARQSARQSERQVIPGLRNATLRDVLAGRYIMAFAEQGVLPSLEILFEHMADAVYLLDPVTSNILWCNRAAYADLGLQASEVLHHSVLSLQKDVQGLPQWADIAQVIRTADCYTFVGRHRHQDGGEIPVEVNTTHFSHQGRDYFLSVARNISKRLSLDGQAARATSGCALLSNRPWTGCGTGACSPTRSISARSSSACWDTARMK
jgi:PAS domain S-box